MSEAVRQLQVSKIRARADQPRETFKGIDELAKSIELLGLMEPIVVRPKDDGFEIIAGERRFRAVKQLGWPRIAALVQDVGDDEAFRLAAAENMARQDMNPIEEARAIERLVEMGWNFDTVEKALGLYLGMAEWRLKLLKTIPEVQHLVATGQLPLTRAVQMSQLSRNGQLKALRLAGARAMTYQEFAGAVEAIVMQENQSDMFPETKVTEEQKATADEFTQALAAAMGACARLSKLDGRRLDGAMEHKAVTVGLQIDELVKQLGKIRLRLGRAIGKQVAMEDTK